MNKDKQRKKLRTKVIEFFSGKTTKADFERFKYDIISSLKTADLVDYFIFCCKEVTENIPLDYIFDFNVLHFYNTPVHTKKSAAFLTKKEKQLRTTQAAPIDNIKKKCIYPLSPSNEKHSLIKNMTIMEIARLAGLRPKNIIRLLKKKGINKIQSEYLTLYEYTLIHCIIGSKILENALRSQKEESFKKYLSHNCKYPSPTVANVWGPYKSNKIEVYDKIETYGPGKIILIRKK